MHGLAYLLAASFGQTPSTPPPVIIPPHHVNPPLKNYQVSYSCNGGQREFALVVDQVGRARFVSAKRKGIAVGKSELEAASDRLKDIFFTYVYPQCHEASDLLLVYGALHSKRVLVDVIWVGGSFEASEPRRVN